MISSSLPSEFGSYFLQCHSAKDNEPCPVKSWRWEDGTLGAINKLSQLTSHVECSNCFRMARKGWGARPLGQPPPPLSNLSASSSSSFPNIYFAFYNSMERKWEQYRQQMVNTTQPLSAALQSLNNNPGSQQNCTSVRSLTTFPLILRSEVAWNRQVAPMREGDIGMVPSSPWIRHVAAFQSILLQMQGTHLCLIFQWSILFTKRYHSFLSR